MRILKKIAAFVFLGVAITACDKQQSLQQYYVENQSNQDFVAIDVPTSLFTNAESLTAEQRKTLESIKKINLLAIPKKEGNTQKIEVEQNKVNEILEDEKYQLLMRMGGGDSRVQIYFTGDEEAVDEIIVYGVDENRGMGIARVLGDNMNPSDIINLMQSLQKGDMDMDGLSGITQMFIERTE